MPAHKLGYEAGSESPTESGALMPTKPVREPNRWAVLALLTGARQREPELQSPSSGEDSSPGWPRALGAPKIA